MRLELFDLRFKTLPMRPVLRRIDRFPFERGVLAPQRLDLATKAIVLGFDVFPFAHVPIVARCVSPTVSWRMRSTLRTAVDDDRRVGRPI